MVSGYHNHPLYKQTGKSKTQNIAPPSHRMPPPPHSIPSLSDAANLKSYHGLIGMFFLSIFFGAIICILKYYFLHIQI